MQILQATIHAQKYAAMRQANGLSIVKPTAIFETKAPWVCMVLRRLRMIPSGDGLVTFRPRTQLSASRCAAVEDELTSLVMHRRPRGYDAGVSLRR